MGEDLGNYTILVAEDEPNNFFYLSTVLTRFKASVLHATDGKQAVEMCRENPQIDLVLMDIKMPEMNGYEATMAIHEFRKDLPVIAQTAFAMTSDAKLSLQSGMAGHLSKPINKHELFVMIKKLVPK